MLQALNNKISEPKAPARAQSSQAEKAKAKDLESQLEGADFANELESSLAAEEAPVEGKAKAVEVNPEMITELPVQFQGQMQEHVEGLNQKVFDADLIKDVDQIVQPKSTGVATELVEPNLLGANQLTEEQILKLSQGQGVDAEVEAEIAQAMLKTPQVQTGRSPAIELAKAEIDPQLMNMEDFVSQKNLAVKKSLNNASAYGMPNKAQMNKAGLENGLKSTQTINELGAAESGANGTAMNSQQFILNSQIDLGSNAKANEAQAATKTFNMSNIKTDNPNQIMTQITDYEIQAKEDKEPTVNMRLNHDELGIIDITVNKLGVNQDAIAINIGTHSLDGKNFFQTNSKDLFSHLTNSGLNVSDLKVETPSQTAKNDFDFGGQSGRGGFGQEKQFGSEQNQRRHDSERRQDLWSLLKDKEAA
jgi:hypothetical protein